MLGLVIQMENGVAAGYIWDTTCDACSDSGTFSCIADYPMKWTDVDSKNLTKSFCGRTYCAEADATNCDLRVFVSWVGTDAKGKYLESAGYRLSNFKKQNIGDIYAAMAGITSATRPDPASFSSEAQTAINSAT